MLPVSKSNTYLLIMQMVSREWCYPIIMRYVFKTLIQQIKFLPMASPLSYGFIFQCVLWADPKIYNSIRLNVRKIMKMVRLFHDVNVCIYNVHVDNIFMPSIYWSLKIKYRKKIWNNRILKNLRSYK